MTDQVHPARDNLTYLRQGLELLDRLDAEAYRTETPLCPDSTVGKHLRHCLDFYTAFRQGLGEGQIDYEGRERREDVETRVEAAREALLEIVADLETIGAGEDRRAIQVKADAPLSEGDEPTWSLSTVGRELQFLLSHTIHHFALIGMLLRAHGIRLPRSFGVAPSTLRFWEKSGASTP